MTRKMMGVYLFCCGLLAAVATIAAAADTEVQQVKALRLKSMEIRPVSPESPMLDIVAVVENENDKPVMLSKTQFEFFLGEKDAPGSRFALGKDTAYQGKEILLDAAASKPLTFTINLGANSATALETMNRLLNFLGKASERDYMFMTGAFDFGVQSKKAGNMRNPSALNGDSVRKFEKIFVCATASLKRPRQLRPPHRRPRRPQLRHRRQPRLQRQPPRRRQPQRQHPRRRRLQLRRQPQRRRLKSCAFV